jgi:hypothetical protein
MTSTRPRPRISEPLSHPISLKKIKNLFRYISGRQAAAGDRKHRRRLRLLLFLISNAGPDSSSDHPLLASIVCAASRRAACSAQPVVGSLSAAARAQDRHLANSTVVIIRHAELAHFGQRPHTPVLCPRQRVRALRRSLACGRRDDSRLSASGRRVETAANRQVQANVAGALRWPVETGSERSSPAAACSRR